MLITLAGSVKIEHQGAAPRHLASAQAQVAFARLTLERSHGTGRDQLADTVWPDGLPDTWASALRSVVSRVRAFVGSTECPHEAPVVAQGGRYLLRLPAEASVDLERAEESVHEAGRAFTAGAYVDAQRAAAAGVTCLRSPFLPEHEGEWVNAVRERVHGLLISGLETASLAAAAVGDDRAALRYADEAVRQAPLRESAHRCRMTAHAAAGNRAEALRAYHRLRRMLAEELGVDPAPETQAAYLDLLGGAADAPPAAGPVRPATAPPPFVGRAAELATVADAWARAGRGESRMLLITGPPGIGKTRLAAAAAHRVGQDGGTVMYGRCDNGTTVPFQPFLEALGGFVAATPDDAIPELSPRGHAALRDLATDGGPDAGTPARRAELLRAFGEVVTGVARERAVLLLLDGVDGADRDSLLLLRRLLRQRTGTALLVLATAGTGTGGGQFAAALADADADGVLDRIVLAGLAEPEVLRLMRAAAPDPAGRPTPNRLMDDTGGNPYLLLHLLRWRQERDAGDGLPAEILEYAAARIAALDEAPRQLLRAAAVAGSSFELDLVAQAAELDPDRALDALDALVAARLVAEVAGPDHQPRAQHEYRITQAVLRRAVYAQASRARRSFLHTRLADAIELYRRPELTRYSEALAHHRAAGASATGDARAVHWGWRAAARMADHGAAREAIRLHRQALDHVPAGDHDLRAEALVNLGLAELAAGVTDCEQNLFDGAIRALHRGRITAAARAVLGLADAVTVRPRLRSEAVALLDSVVGAAGQAGDEVSDVLVGRLLARQARLGVPVRGGAAARAATVAMTHELTALEGPDRLELRRDLATDMLDIAVAVGDRTAQLVAAHHRATAAELAGDVAARESALTALAVAARSGRGGSAPGETLLVEYAVAAAVTQGRFVDAGTATRMVRRLNIAMEGIGPHPGAVAERQMLVARWLQAGTWPAEGTPFSGAIEQIEQSLAALAAGERGMAHLTIRALATGAAPLPGGDDWLHVMGLLALGAAELGDPATAQALRDRLVPYTSATCGVGYRSYVGPVALHLGRLSAVVGDWMSAERHLTAALSQLADRGARPWMALAQASLANVLESRGRAGDRRYADALRCEADQSLRALGLRRRAG